MNCADKSLLDFFAEYHQEAILLAGFGLRCADGLPNNVKICKKGAWNDRMLVETSFSLLTVVCHAKKFHHRLGTYIEARLAYTLAMFNVCLKLFHQLHPDESPFKMSMAVFSL